MAKYFSPNLLDADEKLKLFHYSTYFYYNYWPHSLFGIIYEFYCTISTNFCIYL